MKNRSVPADSILPHIYYENLSEAAAWLTQVFGFVEHYRIEFPEGHLHGVMMQCGDAWVMLKESSRMLTSPAKIGGGTQFLMLFVQDIDDHYLRIKSSGARIVEELFDTEYGERHYGVQDLEGHVWQFSQHVRDVAPESFGAKMAAKA